MEGDVKRIIAAWLWIFVLGAGCDDSQSMDPTVLIGAAMDVTGSAASPNFQDAIKLAIADANKGFSQSGLAKYASLQVNLIINDTKGLTGLAPQRALELRDQGVKGIIIQQAPTSLAANALNYDADAANDLHVPLVCPNCKLSSIHNAMAVDSDPAIQAAERDAQHRLYLTEMNGQQDTDIRLLQIFGTKNAGDWNGDGKVKIGVYAGIGSTWDGFRARVQVDALKVNVNALIEDQVQYPGNADISSYDFISDAKKLIDNQTGGTIDGYPDAIVVQGQQGFEAGITKAFRDLGATVPIIHNANFRSALVLQTLADAANDEEGTSPPLVANTPSGATFTSEYTDAYIVSPETEDAQCYDAGMVLALAIVIATEKNHLADPRMVTGEQVLAALQLTSDKSPGTTLIGTGPAEFAKAVNLISAGLPIDYDGAGGPQDFDALGGVKNLISHWKVVDQRFVEVAQYDCISSSTCPLK
jgi:hypothetical protein